MDKETIKKQFEDIKNNRKGTGIQQIWISTSLKNELETLKQRFKSELGFSPSIADVIAFYVNNGKEIF